MEIITEKPLTVKEAAELTGFSMPYMYKLIHMKKIPYYKPFGGKVLFNRQELLEYCFKNRHSSNAELAEKADSLLTRGKK